MTGLWRRRWRAVAVAWGVAALIWAAVLLAPQTYQSRAHVYAEAEPVTSGAVLRDYYRQRVDAMRVRLLTRPHLEKIVSRAGFDAALSGLTDDARLAGMERLTRRVADNLSVESPAAMYLVISYRDRDPATALAGAEAALDVLMEEAPGAPPGAAGGGDRFWDEVLSRRIAEQEDKLARNEQAIAALKRDREPAPAASVPAARVPAPPVSTAASTAALPSDRRRALRRANEELASARARMTDLLNRASAMMSREAMAGAERTGPESAGAVGDVMRLRLQLAELRSRASDSAAEILTTEARIAQLEQSGGRAADGDYVRLQTDLQAALDSVALLKARRDVLRDALNAPSSEGAEGASVAEPSADPAERPDPVANLEAQKLQNDQRALKSAHAALASLREQAPPTAPGGVAYTVLEPPRIASSPAGPSRLPLVVGGFFLAIAAGLTAAAAQGAVDGRFSDEAALENAVGRPVLGAVSVAPSVAVTGARRRGHARFAAACLGLVLAGAACAWFAASPSFAAPLASMEAQT